MMINCWVGVCDIICLIPRLVFVTSQSSYLHSTVIFLTSVIVPVSGVAVHLTWEPSLYTDNIFVIRTIYPYDPSPLSISVEDAVPCQFILSFDRDIRGYRLGIEQVTVTLSPSLKVDVARPSTKIFG